jgi:hypothetical protein
MLVFALVIALAHGFKTPICSSNRPTSLNAVEIPKFKLTFPWQIQRQRSNHYNKLGEPVKDLNLGVTPPPSPQTSISLVGTKDAMPTLGLGTWKLEKTTCARTVVDALKLGYRHLDCACDYGNEREVGKGIFLAIKEGIIASRQEVFVTSKVKLISERYGRVPYVISWWLSYLIYDQC